MKPIWGKFILLASGILALVGINTPSVQATVQYNKQISEIKQNTPLYLKLGGNFISNYGKQKPNVQIAEHYSHSSHASHSSHYSHYSSRY